MERRDLVAAIAFALLTLPFHPHWLDFELARRGLAMLLGAAALLSLSIRGARAYRSPAIRWLIVLVVWAAVRAIGVTNGGEAFLHATYLAALFCAFVYGTSRPPAALAKIVLPTLGVVVAYGLLQSLGVQWPTGYARTEAVSTLGNRNVASEFVTVGLSALIAATIHAGGPSSARTGVAKITMVASAIYLVANGSRSGIVTMTAIGVLATILVHRRSRLASTLFLTGATLLAVSLPAAGWLRTEPPDATVAAAADGDEVATEPSTIAVRKEIWKSGLAMIADAPIVGHGTGQFRYVYPKYRSQAEIELSTFGRRFATFVATAHNDHLEVWIERGAIGWGLWVGFWIALFLPTLRRQGRPALGWTLPCLAFVAIAFVRSPTTNAPAAIAAFAFAGAVSRQSTHDDDAGWNIPRWAAWSLATVLAIAGLAIVIAQFRFAAGVRPVEGVGRATIERGALDDAITWHPFEARLRSARIQSIRGSANSPHAAFEEARNDVDAIRRLDPDNPTARYRIAELAHFGGEDADAETELDRVLAIDPRHIEATLLRASRFALAGQAARAVQSLYHDPSPRLRSALADQLAQLADGIRSRDAAGADVLAAEARFVRAVDALLGTLGSDPDDRPNLTKRPATIRSDRLRVLWASRFLVEGDRAAAEALAPPGPLDMSESVRRLLAPLLERLADDLPRWRHAVAAGI